MSDTEPLHRHEGSPPGGLVGSAATLHQVLHEALGHVPLPEHGWILYGRPRVEQGWKLHVSATIITALEVLRRVLPILGPARVSFKVTESLACLADLNSGAGGYSQVGKFITLYPHDDAQAVALAERLHAATRGLAGPTIPSDRPLREGSLVHYRYGSFSGEELVDPLGQVTPAIRSTRTGELVPDERGPIFKAPDWAVDPFVAAGLSTPPREPAAPLFAGFLILSALHQSPKGGVYLALDPRQEPPRLCVLKEARKHLITDALGRDIRDRLRVQYDVLRALEPTGFVPRAYSLFEHEENLYLAMEHLEGQTLREHVTAALLRGRRLSVEHVLDLAEPIATAVAALHDAGHVVRDLTPSNVFITHDGSIKLLDFELVFAAGDERVPYGWGTPGYVSPQQATWARPSVQDDVYALGALLFYAMTGFEPVFVVRGSGDMAGFIELHRDDVPPRWAAVIAACVHEDPTHRPQGMREVLARLRECRQELPGWSAPRLQYLDRCERGGLPAPHHSRDAIAIADLLLRTAARDDAGIYWASSSGTTRSPYDAVAADAMALPRRQSVSLDLHNGGAGIISFLCEISQALGDSRYTDAAIDAGYWLLAHFDRDHRMAIPSLHFGRAGVAACLLRLAEVTEHEPWLAQARRIAADLRPETTRIPDLTHGWAGLGMLCLLGYQVADADDDLARACDFGDALRSTAEAHAQGVGWRHPAGPYTGMSGEVLTGMAHGSAGIGSFLIELWRATGREEYLHTAIAAASLLASVAEPCLEDESGENWPLKLVAAGSDDARDRWFYWCHGAAGIGMFFARLWAATGDERWRAHALRCARTVAESVVLGGGALCHGLPGNGCALLDMAERLGAPECRTAAGRIAALLDHLEQSEPDGSSVWPSEQAGVCTPDLMVGMSGSATFFLRLGSGARLPTTRVPLV